MISENSNKPFVIVLGNEKGGTGKSTIAMHLIVNIMRLGFKVGSVDCDAHQGTLTRYYENRVAYIKNKGVDLPIPEHHTIQQSDLSDIKANESDERSRTEEVFAKLQACDLIIVDTPGNDTYLSRLVHSYADTLITPLNDSFVDLDVLIKITNLDSNEIIPSSYAELIWQHRKQKLVRDKVTLDWIVLRNRLSNIRARNKEEMWQLLQQISKRLGFRLGAGFGERVIFRELFLSGMTLLDLKDTKTSLTLSHVAARQELRELMRMIQLPMLEEKLKEAS